MRSITTWFVALVIGLSATACASGKDADVAEDLPAGAISNGDGTYMVPMGADPDGCARFRMYSPTGAVAMVIYYRAKDGGFTMDRGAADCPPLPPRPGRPDR
jgi:hypothetical protein